MTSNRRTKKLIRNHMESTGLCYLEAKRSLEAIDPGAPAPLALIDGIPVTAGRGGTGGTGFRRHEPNLGKIIAVTSSRGGVGKTTLSIGLASYLSRASAAASMQGLSDRPGWPMRPRRVLLLDLDVRDGQIGGATGHWKPTVMRIRRFGISPEEIKNTTIYDENLQIDLLLSPRRARSADELPLEFYEELLRELKSLYDYIVVDTSVSYLDPLFEKVVYPQADQILLATDPYASTSMARWISAVTESESRGGMGISKDKIQVVANRMLKSHSLEMVVSMSEGLPVVSSIPAKPKLFGQALDNSEMGMIFEDQKLRRAFGKLARAVADPAYPLADFE